MADSPIILERPPLGIASMISRKGVDAAALENALGCRPPEGPIRIEHDGLAIIGTGPSAWLATTDVPEIGWPAALEHKLKGVASISDQSGSYAVFRVIGDNARSLLQRGAFIDLHPDVFRQGSVATTVIAHIGVILWQVDDRPTFDIATFRSYAPSFRRWLNVSAASF